MISKKSIILFLVTFFLAQAQELSSQNPKADGYMGLWSKTGQVFEYGYKLSGGLATFSPQHRPPAIYSPVVDKTFFLYCGTRSPEESHLQIMISYFDHKSNRVPRPVIVCDKMGVTDPQDNAALSIDKDGYLWVFVSGRGRTRPGLIFKSSQPYSIDKFDQVFEGEIVFPQPWWIKDSCFVMMYTKVLKGRELFCSTSADGISWSEGKKIAGMGGHFQTSDANGNVIYTVFTYFPEGNLDKRTNLYLLKTEDLGRTWKTVDNRIVQTPLTSVQNEALVFDYEAEKKLVYINDINFDKDGNPVILIITSHDFRPGPAGDPREWMVIHWKDGEWIFNKVCESDNNYDMGPLFTNGDEWRIIAPTGQGPQKYGAGGEMALWTSIDEDESWGKVLDITEGSKLNNSYPRKVWNANKEFYAFWADGDVEKLSVSHLYFTNQKCDRVWVLPYNMKKDLERPVRIK
jgi:hypothetical protein